LTIFVDALAMIAMMAEETDADRPADELETERQTLLFGNLALENHSRIMPDLCFRQRLRAWQCAAFSS
jgi:uncharacterized protein with PIN domain